MDPNAHLLDGSHDRLDDSERVSSEAWLTFMRHHPDLHLLSHRIRTESQKPWRPA